MILRKYRPEDLEEICELFYETINNINIKDYNRNQIKVWSSCKNSLLKRNDLFMNLYTIVAVEDDKIVGYGNIDDNGYLDHLYVHHDYQGQHIATVICNMLEYGKNELSVHASISAKPFFEKRGYMVMKEQEIGVDGVYLTNYLMKKEKVNEN